MCAGSLPSAEQDRQCRCTCAARDEQAGGVAFQETPRLRRHSKYKAYRETKGFKSEAYIRNNKDSKREREKEIERDGPAVEDLQCYIPDSLPESLLEEF